MKDDDPDDPPDLALISDAQRLAAMAEMLLENPKLVASQGSSEFYETAHDNSKLILRLVGQLENCSSAEEFDVLLYLICRHADGLARALSLLRIP